MLPRCRYGSAGRAAALYGPARDPRPLKRPGLIGQWPWKAAGRGSDSL